MYIFNGGSREEKEKALIVLPVCMCVCVAVHRTGYERYVALKKYAHYTRCALQYSIAYFKGERVVNTR